MNAEVLTIRYWSDLDTERKLEAINCICIDGSSANDMTRQLGNARIHGTTRNAIIGMFFRHRGQINIDLRRPYSRLISKKPLKDIPKRIAPKFMEKLDKKPIPAEAEKLPSKFKTLLDLERDECRWPTNNPEQDGQHLFCANSISKGSYCAYHNEIGRRDRIRSEEK